MTRTRLLGKSISASSTREAGAVFSLLARNPSGVLPVYSLILMVGTCISSGDVIHLPWEGSLFLWADLCCTSGQL